MKIVSIRAKVSKSLLNKVIDLDIDFKVKQVKKLPISPKAPTMHTIMPDEMKRILSKASSFPPIPPHSAVTSAALRFNCNPLENKNLKPFYNATYRKTLLNITDITEIFPFLVRR